MITTKPIVKDEKMHKIGRKHTKPRLYTRATVIGYKRGKTTQYPQRSLLSLDGVQSRSDAEYYLGKRVAFVYVAKTVKRGTRLRAIRGKVTKLHGNSGVVQARFKHNLPPQAHGGRVRVFMYPSRI